MTVLISMVAGSQSTICQIRDLVRPGSSGSITIESLAFDQFVTVLREDIQFDIARHSISYHCTKGITVPIANERSWKAAIWEMHVGEMDRFVFHIEERGKSSSVLVTNITG
jgi:hypothetical protein